MKSKIFKAALTALALIILTGNSYSQDKFPGIRRNQSTETEKLLMTEFSAAKISGNMPKMQEIQYQMDKESGSVTLPAEHYPGTFVLLDKGPTPFNGDNINIVEISTLNGVRALATATEQRGQNIGRIWVLAAISNSTARDTIYYFRSDDGGISWVTYGYLSLANEDQVNYDQMDFEIIEDVTGDKYLWLAYGLTAFNGKQYVGATVLKTPNFLANMFAFTWPGENYADTSFGRFRPRITTDNAKYSNTASIFMSVSVDTFDGFHEGFYNFAKCVNPYTTTPSITYYGRSAGFTPTFTPPTDLHSDISYIHNGGDSILFVGSNYYEDPEYLGVGALNINFDITIASGTNLPNLSAFNKDYGRIACSGGTNQRIVMVVYRDNYQNSGDWDLKGYRSEDGGVNWGISNIDIRRDNVMIPYPADINAVRNRDGRFNIAYTVSGPGAYDTVKYLFTNAGVPGLYTRTVNHLSGFERPKPGFRLVDGDSCFAVWSQRNGGSGNNIWAVDGCSGAITIGIQNTGSEIPISYKLEQNYPNPFNPVTNIKFSIPKSGNVKLVVYDITGKIVAELVNENLNPGTYKTDFDASGISSGVYFYKLTMEPFSEVKKMILIK